MSTTDQPLTSAPEKPVTLLFEDNALLARLVGDHDRNLRHMEEGLDIQVAHRGNRISIRGTPADVAIARTTLSTLYQKLAAGGIVDVSTLEAVIRMTQLRESTRHTDMQRSAPAHQTTHATSHTDSAGTFPALKMRHGVIEPRSPGQAAYMQALAKKEMVFGIGPAGTGKTYLAVAQAVAMLQAGSVDRIILSRPAVEAGERLGFLPGDMKDKIDLTSARFMTPCTICCRGIRSCGAWPLGILRSPRWPSCAGARSPTRLLFWMKPRTPPSRR